MGRLIIPENAHIYVDTAPVIYSVESHPEYVELLQPLWVQLHTHSITVISSELLWLETLVSPYKDNNQPLVKVYTEVLRDSLQLIAIDESILKSAAKIRSTTKLKGPDSIHAATALSRGCTMFLTNDTDFGAISNLPVVVLKDILNA
jgi:predicted nucleic acid-binding protein